MTLKIIIGLLIINLLYTYYLRREILNPKRYYVVEDINLFVSYVQSNGALSYGFHHKPKWRLSDAMKVKEVYPHLRIFDCVTLEELEE